MKETSDDNLTIHDLLNLINLLTKNKKTLFIENVFFEVGSENFINLLICCHSKLSFINRKKKEITSQWQYYNIYFNGQEQNKKNNMIEQKWIRRCFLMYGYQRLLFLMTAIRKKWYSKSILFNTYALKVNPLEHKYRIYVCLCEIT